MLRSIFWFGVGAAAGVYVYKRVKDAQANLGPEGFNRFVERTSSSIEYFADTMRNSMNQREGELRTALGIADPDRDLPDNSHKA